MQDLSVVLCGEAGQGIQTVENILMRILKRCGYHVYAHKEYMSRIRGGVSSTEIRVATERVTCFVDQIDILLPLSQQAIGHLTHRLSDRTLICGEPEYLAQATGTDESQRIEVPWKKLVAEIGGPEYMNMVAMGFVCALFQVEEEIIATYVRKHFQNKSEEIIAKNMAAVRKGYATARTSVPSQVMPIDMPAVEEVRRELLLDGSTAVGLGALAGGCNFLTFYPMSPATAVAEFLAQHAEQFGLIVEQAEDEIAAINMALGASYAGARSLVTTSGGGFSLMQEGLSLAGMIETPVVIHLGQRPGPATGLPTRTEQGDLWLARFGGHGDFPRIIYSPGTVEDAFSLTQHAFNMAEKYQVPVFILSDAYLLNSYYNIPGLDVTNLKVDKQVVFTDQNYQRFKITENGISPRGIPGFGVGLVCVDSDEHDESGHMTENLHLRRRMVDKRIRKMNLMQKDVLSPELIGAENYRTLIIGWGSTRNVVREALARLNRDHIAFLHLNQVYPLPLILDEYLKKARETIAIENNSSSQLSQLIKMETGFTISRKILKYNGAPFSREEVVKALKTILEA